MMNLRKQYPWENGQEVLGQLGKDISMVSLTWVIIT